MSLRKTMIAAVAAASVTVSGFVTPSFAAPARPAVDAGRLDAAQAEYAQYRGYRGRQYGRHYGRGHARGAAIAGAIGLGILGAAAIAASRPAYAERRYYYEDDGYDGYRQPVYAAPRVYHAPPRYYYREGYDFRNHR